MTTQSLSPASYDPGLRLGDPASLAQATAQSSGRQSSNGLTAATTQTQAAATACQYGLNTFSSVANANDGGKLPQAKPGVVVMVANNGGNVLSLFPYLGDKINDAAANAAVSVADNTLSIYMCTVAGTWFGGAITLET